MVRRIVLLLVVLLACGFVVLVARDPEKSTLDAAARQGVAGAFVTLGDGVTHYEVAGPDAGDRIVLVHGFSTPAYIWDSTAIALVREGFRVARYDVFGRGWSDRPAVEYSADLFDRQLGQLLDSLGWREPVHIAGLSRGGPIVATFAGRHPERVRSLTLVDPAAAARGSLPAMFTLPVVGPVIWQGVAVAKMADNQLGDFYQPSRWPDWPERYRVQMRYKGFGRALLSTIENDRTVSPDSVYRAAGATKVPTLLFWGKEDTVVPFAYSDSVRRAIPQAEFHPIDSAAHLPHMERATEVNAILVAFLRAHAAPRDTAVLH